MKLTKLIRYLIKRMYIPFHIKLSLSHVLIAFLPICIIYYVSYNIYSQSILSEASDRMTNVVLETREEVDKTLKSMKTLLISTSSSSTIKNIFYNPQWIKETPVDKKIEEYQRINDLFYGILYLRDSISSVRMIPLRGSSIIWYDNRLSIGYPHPEIPWYKEVVRSNLREEFIPPHKAQPPSLPEEVFTVAKIARDYDGNIIGTILVDGKVDTINSIINNVSNTNKIQIGILDKDGSVIFRSNNLQYEKFLDNELLLQIQENENGTLNYEMNNDKYMLMYDTCRESEWKFIAFTRVSSLLEEAYKVRDFTLLVGIITIIISLIVSIIISITVTRPIKRLNLMMKEVRNRNFDVYLKPTSNDEIGILTRSFNDMVLQIRNLIVKEYQADLKRKEAELKALESQINPHFLYNTLETISSIAYLRDVPEITIISRSLSDIFRYSINTNQKQVTLGDEIYYTSNYINIQKVRHGNKFSVEFNIDDTIKDYKVIKLILQPLIENAINHGLQLIKSNGIITISAWVDDKNILYIEIEDNGIGIEKQKLKALCAYLGRDLTDTNKETIKCLGVANVHFRIRHYYGKEYGLTIQSTEGKGTKITIKIPAILKGRDEGDV